MAGPNTPDIGGINEIQEFDLATRTMSIFAGFPMRPGPMTLCPNGFLYTTTALNGSLHKLDPQTGESLGSFPINPSRAPVTLACKPDGNLLLYGDFNPAAIEEVAPDGTDVGAWASGFSIISIVRGITMTPSGTVAFIVGHPFLSSTNKLVEYDLAGNPLREVIPSIMDRMDDFVFTSDTEILVTHRDSHCIKKYDWTTTPATFVSNFACDPSRVSAISLALHPTDGSVFARDHASGCIWGWDSVGIPLYGGEPVVCYGPLLGGGGMLVFVENGQPPVCDAGGPYLAECGGVATQILLDGTGSMDADGDLLTYLWSTDCPGGVFDDATSPTPVLTVDSGGGCGLVCGVTLTVDDGNGGVESCSTTVTVSDTTPPVVTCSVSAVVGGGGDGDHEDERFLVSYSATDACGSVMTGSAVIETPCCPVPVSDGQIIEFECADQPQCELELDFEDGVLEVEADTGSLSVTATDLCGNTAVCTVDLCPPAGP